jgi:uncharacterized damage-inducible protein DinB
MNKEIKTIIKRIEEVNTGEPWFGRAVYTILDETDTNNVNINPNGGHSINELLYHMITWADFTLRRINKDKDHDLAASEELDWRTIDPAVHTWKKGLREFKNLHTNIIGLLKQKEDSFLDEKVDYRKYNFRFLLNGMIEHTIYHLGQIAYLDKMHRSAF